METRTVHILYYCHVWLSIGYNYSSAGNKAVLFYFFYQQLLQTQNMFKIQTSFSIVLLDPKNPLANAFHCIISYLMSRGELSGTKTAPHCSLAWEIECLFTTFLKTFGQQTYNTELIYFTDANVIKNLLCLYRKCTETKKKSHFAVLDFR